MKVSVKWFLLASSCALLVGSCIAAPVNQRTNASATFNTTAKCDGVTDDTSAIQADIQKIAAGGGSLQFPNGTCRVGGTVSLASINNVALLGHGTTLLGSSGPIFEFGDSSGTTAIKNIQILGFKVTNGAWQSGFYQGGQSAADAIVVHSCQLCDIDVVGENVGGAVVRFSGRYPKLGLRSSIRVKGMDVGYGAYLLHTSNIDLNVAVRRGHINSCLVNDTGGSTLLCNIDETLQPPSATGNQGVGWLMNDVSWSQIKGISVQAALAGLILEGNSQWNTITGTFTDNSTLADGATSNIVIQSNGSSHVPMHNLFVVCAGASGVIANRPAYGIDEVNGAYNQAIGLDATGARDGAVRGSIRIVGSTVTAFAPN